MNRSRRSIAGVGRFGCFVWLVVGVAVGFFVYKVAPVKMKTSQFYDAMVEQASFGSIKGDSSIQYEIFLKAQELQLPLKKEDIRVTRNSSNVTVEVHYSIPIEFPGYTYVWKEDRVITRPLFAV